MRNQSQPENKASVSIKPDRSTFFSLQNISFLGGKAMALNETEVKTGDVVRLNAGGPHMAVERIFPVDAGLLIADCVWFTPDGTCRRAEFLCCTLMVEPFPIDRL